MRISYDDGSTHEGLILALTGPEARVAVRGVEEPVQFNLVGESWYSEDGRRATFAFPLGVLESQEFLVAMEEVSVEGLTKPRACTSGGECLLKRMSTDSRLLN